MTEALTGAPKGMIAAGQARHSESLALATHDIRTELQAIIASVDLMRDGPPCAQEVERLQSGILQSAGIALELVNAAIKLARADQVTVRPQARAFSLAGLIRESVARLSPLAQRAGTRIRIEAPDPDDSDPDDGVSAPPGLLRSILDNLLSNAIKATQNGEIRIILRVKAAPDTEVRQIALQVSDTGRGIQPAQRAQILKMFETGQFTGQFGGQFTGQFTGPDPQVPGADPQGHGVGLLAVCRALEALNGRIEIHDTPGGGATFRLALDLPAAEIPAAEPVTEPDSAATAPGPLTDLRILIVDDNATNRQLFARILTRAGARVTVSEDSAGALRSLLAAPEAQDMVLLDLSMPGLDGISLASRLEQDLPLPRRPLLVGLSAHSDEIWHIAAKAVGIKTLLQKPLRPADLRQALAEAAGAPRAVPAPQPVLSEAQFDELVEDMGAEVAQRLAGQALAESAALLAALPESGVTEARRGELHSALGAAGMTGLGLLDSALRRLQAVSRVCADDSPATARATELLQRAISRTGAALRDQADAINQPG